jgi:hypothetical protein
MLFIKGGPMDFRKMQLFRPSAAGGCNQGYERVTLEISPGRVRIRARIGRGFEPQAKDTILGLADRLDCGLERRVARGRRLVQCQARGHVTHILDSHAGQVIDGLPFLRAKIGPIEGPVNAKHLDPVAVFHKLPSDPLMIILLRNFQKKSAGPCFITPPGKFTVSITSGYDNLATGQVEPCPN